MEIWLEDLQKVLNKMEEKFGNLYSYVAMIQGAYHGIIFCMTSGEIWRYDTDNDTVFQMKGDWR